jgi:hypothetical protein
LLLLPKLQNAIDTGLFLVLISLFLGQVVRFNSKLQSNFKYMTRSVEKVGKQLEGVTDEQEVRNIQNQHLHLKDQVQSLKDSSKEEQIKLFGVPVNAVLYATIVATLLGAVIAIMSKAFLQGGGATGPPSWAIQNPDTISCRPRTCGVCTLARSPCCENFLSFKAFISRNPDLMGLTEAEQCLQCALAAGCILQTNIPTVAPTAAPATSDNATEVLSAVVVTVTAGHNGTTTTTITAPDGTVATTVVDATGAISMATTEP